MSNPEKKLFRLSSAALLFASGALVVGSCTTGEGAKQTTPITASGHPGPDSCNSLDFVETGRSGNDFTANVLYGHDKQSFPVDVRIVIGGIPEAVVGVGPDSDEAKIDLPAFSAIRTSGIMAEAFVTYKDGLGSRTVGSLACQGFYYDPAS
jgi:hypothetical protein